MIRHAGDISKDAYRNVGILMAAVYAISVIPLTFLKTEADPFFTLLMTIPMFTILLAGAIGYHGHKKESLTSLTSIVASQFLFWIGIVLNNPYDIILIALGFTTFLIVPWAIFIKVFLERKINFSSIIHYKK